MDGEKLGTATDFWYRQVFRAKWGDAYTATTPITMLTLYGDASQDGAQKVVIVAGYVATAEAWEEFGWNWKLTLARNNIPYFHMVDFAHSVGPFAHLKGRDGTRANLLRDLVSIISAHVLVGVACAVKRSDFQKVNRDFYLDKTFGNEYALCARDCVVRASKILYRRGFAGHYWGWVFEQGDDGAHHLTRTLLRDQGQTPSFEPSRDGVVPGHPGLVQLQAADIAAYELLKGLGTVESKGRFRWWDMRIPLQRLSHIPHQWGIYKESDLIKGAVKAQLERSREQDESRFDKPYVGVKELLKSSDGSSGPKL